MSTECTCCNKPIDKYMGVNCSICKNPYLFSCVGLTQIEAKATCSRTKRLSWNCANCGSLVNDINDLKAVILNLQGELRDFKASRSDVSASLSDNQFEDILSELDERQKRRKNIIIFGVTEPGSEVDKRDRATQDKMKVVEIVSQVKPDVVIEENVKISRLGKFNADKTRPLRLTFRDENIVHDIINKFISIRGSNASFRNISLSFDRTPKQIEQYKKLKADLDARLRTGILKSLLFGGHRIIEMLIMLAENYFLNYLKRYYFQSDERIRMWAHCHRINVGINTNMAIESLNKVLKYNKMNGQRNLRVEKLLDLLEELVDEIMWKRIVNAERPNANTYQHKITIDAHKKAEQMIGKVQLSENENFKVQSCSVNGKYYFVSYNEVCDEECRAEYCNKCKICLHKYRCQCPENAVKTIICKHIHAVAIFEQRSESVLGLSSFEESTDLCIDEPSTSQLRYQDDVTHFIQETRPHTEPIAFDVKREIMLQEVISYARSLDEQSFNKYMTNFKKFKNDTERQNAENNSAEKKKRKMEKQTYYPRKKIGYLLTFS